MAALAWRKWSLEHLLKPGIVAFPQVVHDALARYGDLFANQCQRRHRAEYLTGLRVAERKTVLGINGQFAQTTYQSCLNRFLTDVEWDAGARNQRRLEELQNDPSTRYSDQGVILIFYSSSPIFDISPFAMGRDSLPQQNHGATS